jgi:GDP-mannose 6-dehydrogenase
MTVVVCGLATVGATMAAWLLERGHQVVGVDTDVAKLDAIAEGQSPVNEPGLAAIFAQGFASGQMRVSDNLADAVRDPSTETVAVAVGTPASAGGGLCRKQLHAATDAIIAGIAQRPPDSPRPLICYRSTMPPGTCRDDLLPRLEACLGRVGERFELAYHPEFLRMGHALDDARAPDRIVLGERFPGASRRLNGLYGNARAQVVEVDFASAELAKMIDNTWRATKVAFANETARLAIASGADSEAVLRVLTSDTKHNLSSTYLRPGLPYGGYCLPKDSAGVAESAQEWGVEAPLFTALAASNKAHADAIVAAIIEQFPPGSRLLQVGLGFKPGSDELRESPLLALAERLLAAGIALAVYDPAFASPEQWPEHLRPCWLADPSTSSAAAIVLGHPWPKAKALPLAPVVDLTQLTSLQPALP